MALTVPTETDTQLDEIVEGIKNQNIVPYLGPGVLNGVVDLAQHKPIPADSDSLILAMTGGKPMAPRLMYEFPRAAMHLENKKGRKFIERFLEQTYGATAWSAPEFHPWLTRLKPQYVIDCNRDVFLQTLYQGTPHTLVVGAARISATPFRFDLYECQESAYRKIELAQVDPALPVLFKPLGSPVPNPSFVASDADFVDYITELMGGFAVPAFLKAYRRQKQYVLLGMRFTRDTERMVFSDLIFDAAEPAGWALIENATEKELRYLAKKNIRVIDADWRELLALA